MTVFQCSRDARDRVKGIPRNAAKARFVDNAIPIGFNFQSISSTPRDTFSNGNAVRLHNHQLQSVLSLDCNCNKIVMDCNCMDCQDLVLHLGQYQDQFWNSSMIKAL